MEMTEIQWSAKYDYANDMILDFDVNERYIIIMFSDKI